VTDAQLTAALAALVRVEDQAVTAVTASGLTADDRRQAEVVWRASLGVRRAIEKWIRLRALRARSVS